MERVERGAEALKYLRGEEPYQQTRRPGLVLMDINMPRQTGFEVLAEMRSDEALARVPVVMLTSSKQESDILMAYANGACSFISKPVSFDRMRDVAQHFALYWALVADVPDAETLSA
ncbi:MAG: response regulator [Planctomycetes bacterium]|nr:response regulator [Planctomycetota bacterium]